MNIGLTILVFIIGYIIGWWHHGHTIQNKKERERQLKQDKKNEQYDNLLFEAIDKNKESLGKYKKYDTQIIFEAIQKYEFKNNDMWNCRGDSIECLNNISVSNLKKWVSKSLEY